jgi:hypothetical protein
MMCFQRYVYPALDLSLRAAAYCHVGLPELIAELYRVRRRAIEVNRPYLREIRVPYRSCGD